MQLTANTKQLSGPETFSTHLQFCKSHLEVNNKASNIACRTKLGCFPLNITINKKILNYILYIIFSLKMKNTVNSL